MLTKDIQVVNKILTGSIKSEGEKFLINGEEKSKGPYSSYSLIYPYTNDELKEYETQVKAKKVLTVTGSGDQALMAIKNGAEQVQMFDINKLSKYYANLKFAAVRALSYEEYVDFFNSYDDLFFSNYDYKTFEKILPKLSAEDAVFWYNLYNAYFCLYNYKLINMCYSFNKSPLRFRCDYDKIKANLNNCNIQPFIETDIFYLDEKLKNSKYDAILFSNITSYLDETQIPSLYNLLQRLEKNLKDDGIIQIAHFVKSQHYYDGQKLIRKNELSLLSEKLFDKMIEIVQNNIYVKDAERSLTLFYKKK